MSLARRVAGAGHLVRVLVLALVVLALPTVLALREFDRHYGVPVTVGAASSCTGAACSGGWSPEVAAVVRSQEDAGLACGTAPALTDVVVVEHPDGSATSTSLAGAVRQSAEGGAVVRASCRHP